jgi:hypothetical protein
LVRKVRRPQVLVAFGVSSCPSSTVGECSADIFPGGAVGGGLQTNAVGCESGKIGAIGLLNNCWVVDEGVTVDRAWVDGSLFERGCECADGEDASGEDAAERDHVVVLSVDAVSDGLE